MEVFIAKIFDKMEALEKKQNEVEIFKQYELPSVLSEVDNKLRLQKEFIEAQSRSMETMLNKAEQLKEDIRSMKIEMEELIKKKINVIH